MQMKLWKYYIRKKTNARPECKVRCVGVYPNAYVIQFEDKNVVFVNKYHRGEMSLYENLPRPINLENK